MDAAMRGAEAVGDSEEDGEDVFEVEKILDMKTEGVRKGPGRLARSEPNAAAASRARAATPAAPGAGGASGL
jgi:hypothetical protein